MTVFHKQSLITELLDRTELIKASSQLFLRLTDDQLNFKSGLGHWSIAEIFEQLNTFNETYVRHILPRITSAPDISRVRYKSSWVGDWLYEKTMPGAERSVKLDRKQGRLYEPARPLEGREVLSCFQQGCDALDDILRHVATKNLQRIKIPLRETRFFRLRLGDSLRYIVAYNERHLLQARMVLATFSST